MFKVSKRTLLLIAGIVWFAAGGNIAWLGIQAFAQINMSYVWAIILGAVVVFTLFHMKIFSKMVSKHSNRIAAYEDDKIGFWRFFDASGYIMMAIMMSGGISLRAFGLVPMWFIAFFYTGLGIALALSGVSFLVRFARRSGIPATCPFSFLTLSREKE